MRTLLVVIALGAVACSSSVSDSSLPCDTDLQCPAGTFCQMGTCAVLPSAHGVTIDAPNPVTAGKTLQLVVHAVGAVTWTVQEAGGGTVDATGLYHAPATPGTYHAVATSIADATQSATVTITVVAPAVATITAPEFVTLDKGGYTASVPSQSGATYAWTITGGTINSGAATASITFTAGSGSTVALAVTVTDAAGDGTSGSYSSTIVAAVAEPVLAGDALTNGAARVGVSAGAHVVEPPSGLTYAWSIVGGTFSGTSTGSTATGQSVTYQGSQEGSLTLTCVATSQSGDTATNSLSVTLVGAAVATSTVTAAAGNTTIADGSTPIALTVSLVDANNNPVFADAITISALAPAGVAFSGAGGTVNSDGSLSAVTGSDGAYSFNMASTKAGSNTVQVSVDGTQLSATVVFLSGYAAASTSTLTADRTSTVADGVQAITFTVTILDAFGNPVLNEPVQFKDGSADASAVLNTDGLGHATYKLTSQKAGVPHTVTVVAGPGQQGAFTVPAPPSSGITVVFVAGDPDPAHTKVTLADGVTPANGATGVADNVTPISYLLTAADAFGNATPGVTISVSAGGSNNTIVPPSGQTNAGGIFTWALTTKTAEQKSLTITVPQPLAQKTFQITLAATFTAGAPAQLQSSIESSTSSITASQGSSAATITATVRDQFSNLVSGAAVQFSSSGSNNSFTNGGAATSGSSGTATSALSSTTAESKMVTASVGSGANIVSLTLATPIVVGPAAASPGQSTLVPDSNNVVADNVHVINYTATVRDQFGNLEPGLAVATSATGSNDTLSASTGATNASGVFLFSLKTKTAEQKTVAISDATSTPPDLLAQTLSTFIGGAATSGTLAANPTTVGADGVAASTLTATAYDQFSNLSPGAAVVFSLQQGTGTFAHASGSTSSSGVYTTTLTANTVETAIAGGTIAGAAGSITLAPVTINFVPGDASGNTTTLTTSVDPVTADGATLTTITLQVEDALGHTIANLGGVGLTVSGSGNTFSFTGPGTTDSNGKITATLKSTVAENKTITATVPQTLAGTTLTKTLTAHFVAGVPVASKSTFVSTPQSPLTANNVATTALLVTLRDANNNLVPGASVSFTPIASGDTLTPSAAQTSSSAGTASATLASTVAGTQQVSANISGSGFTAFSLGPVSVTFTPGDPSATKTTLTATPVSPATVTADGSSTFTITLSVADANGNKLTNLSGVQIASDGINNTFAAVIAGGVANGSTISGSTDSSGNFSATLATTKAQTKNISATIPKPLAGGALSVSGLALTFVAGPPTQANSLLTASPNMLVADGVTTSTLTLTLLDANNNPAPAYSVLTPGTGFTKDVFGNNSANVNNTVYTNTIKSTGENSTDSVGWCFYPTAAAQAMAGSGMACESVQIDFTAGPANSAKSTITPAPTPSVTTDSPNNTVTIAATFLDQYSNPLSGAATVTVTGSTNTFPGSVTLSSGGVASFSLVSTHAETKTITVTLGTFSLTTKVKFIPGAPVAANSTFSVTPTGSAPVYADGSQSYTVTLLVEDAGGNKESGLAVQLSASGAHTYFSPASGTLASNGTFFSTLTSYLAQTESLTAIVGGLTLSASGVVFTATPWQPATGLSGGRVTGIAFDPNNNQAVYASTLNGVMASTNNGASWTPENAGMETLRAVGIAATNYSGTGTVLVALGNTTGALSGTTTAYRSVNAGSTWSLVNLPAATNFIASTGSSGGFVTSSAASTDSGQTWTTSTLSSGAQVTLVSMAVLGTSLIALNKSSSGPEVVLSTNGGLTWTAANSAVNCGGNPGSIAVDGSSSTSVYYTCVNSMTLYHSANGGTTFAANSTSLPDNGPQLLVGDPSQAGRLIYANTYGELFELTQASSSWNLMFYEDQILANAIVFEADNHSNVWVGTSEGNEYQLYGEMGPDFTPGITVATPSGTGSNTTYSLAIKNSGMNDAAISKVQFLSNGTAYTYSNGFYTSTNGSSWALLPGSQGVEYQTGNTLADVTFSVNSTGTTIYARTDTLNVYRGTVSASTIAWTPIQGSSFSNFTPVASPTTPGLVYAYGYSNSSGTPALFSSSTQGNTWDGTLATSSQLPTNITGLQISALNSNALWIQGLNNTNNQAVIRVSQDGGRTFPTVLTPGYMSSTLLLDPNNEGNAYASGAYGAIYYSNYGASSTVLPVPGSTGGTWLALDANGSTLYCLVNDNNGNAVVYKSTNGGTAWTAATEGLLYGLESNYTLLNIGPQTFASSPTTSGLLVVGTDRAGIFYATNGGQ